VISEFKYDPLPLVAVSVDMLDTGYDQKDVENLVMLRPTQSPIKYAQMRGRGSRLCPKINKTEFIIYDFWATPSGSMIPERFITNPGWSRSGKCPSCKGR